MSNISIKINLRQLKSAVRVMKTQSGDQECLIIPIDGNNLFKGEKALYLDITAHEIKERKADSKDTHLLKQNLSKEVYDKLSDEQKQALPILGNAIYWGKREAQPQNIEVGDVATGEDDLPF